MIKKLENLSFAEWSAMKFTPFANKPETTKFNVENGIIINLVGWLQSAPTSSIGFVVNTEKGMQQDTTIGINGQILETETSLGNSTEAETYYYVVDIGIGAKASDWSLSFKISDGKKEGSPGTWVFSKAKVDEVISD